MSKVCPPCDNELKAESILEHYCASDFALRLKVKEVRRERGDRKLVAAQKKKKVLKLGALRKKELKKLVLTIRHGASCPCPQLDGQMPGSPSGPGAPLPAGAPGPAGSAGGGGGGVGSAPAGAFLVLGRRVEQQLLVLSIHKWDKRNKELKFALKYIKSHQCPSYHSVF